MFIIDFLVHLFRFFGPVLLLVAITSLGMEFHQVDQQQIDEQAAVAAEIIFGPLEQQGGDFYPSMGVQESDHG